MPLSEFCVESNWAWDSDLGSAYHYTRPDGEVRTIFRYQIPFSPDKEALLLAKYNIPAEERLRFYQNFVRCIQRQVNVSKYLEEEKVNSILTYINSEQIRSEQGTVSIYLETEQVWPILQHLLVGEVPAITVLDAVSRLAVILRDINREQIGVVHRALDLREVYISAKNKILMGGFFYASCQKLGPYPDFLCCSPAHIVSSVRHGNPGSHKTDIQALSAIAWNLFSGLPHDCEHTSARRIAPEYSFPELNNALLMGLAGEDEVCNIFRRRLSDCRKILNKAALPQMAIPIRSQRVQDIRVSWL